jgi:hypothetical protein
MDTGGKDGAVKGLCAGINPAGLAIRDFKVPSQEELDHDFLWRAHVLDRCNQVILDLLSPESPPTRTLEVMVVGGIGKTALD